MQCTATKRWLREREVEYQEFDVEQDEQARLRAQRLGASGLPVVVVGDRWWQGFRPDMLRREILTAEPVRQS